MYSAIEKLYYIKRHPHKFEKISIPLGICMRKLTVEVLTEVVSLALTAGTQDPRDVVMNYIALGVIAELDEVYFYSIRSPLKEQMAEQEFQIPITNTGKVKLDQNKSLHIYNRVQFFMLKIIRFLYEALYFHMFPYLLFVFLSINHKIQQGMIEDQ